MTFRKSESDSATVHEIFQGEVLYKSPLFQRHYVWSNEELDALWTDIDTVLEESASSRFLGALVLKSYQNRSASRPQAFWIIDGQQRLTTFYLLLLACAVRASELGASELARDYVRSYLLQQQSSVSGDPKLIPTIPDFGQFKEILRFLEDYSVVWPGGGGDYTEGPLIDAFLRHQEEIEKRIQEDEEPSADRLQSLVEAISEKIEFVQINLADHHDPNEVFNRLNVSGQPLEVIDLVRNEVFSLLSDDVNTAEQIYHSYWDSFEKAFSLGDSKEEIKRSTDVRNGFFFPFALMLNPGTKKSSVFEDLARRWRKETVSLEPTAAAKRIINELKDFVPPYLAIATGDRLPKMSDSGWESVLRLYRMPAPSSLYPYSIKLLSEFLKGNVNESNVAPCLDVIESFLIRRAFLGLEPTGLHAVFKDLWKKAGADPATVRECVQTKTIEFPDDERFQERIKVGDLYHRKLCRYVLEEYERSFTKGDVLKTFPKVTIDHLMPQYREGEWKAVMSAEDHETFVHTWANLVPLSDKANAEKSAKSWADVKKNLKDETVFSSTRRVLSNYDEWDVETIKERSEELSAWALKRWPK